MREVDFDDDSLLALEVEAALKGLRIATQGENDDALRSAVQNLRRASLQLKSPSIGSASAETAEPQRTSKASFGKPG